MARKKKNNMSKYFIWIGVLLLLAVILLLVYYSSTEMTRSMKNEGYTTEDSEDPFYKKITTGNTLDDFYNALSENKDTAYEEYYLQKDSYNFIEQKLFYQNGISSSLNIRSDLRNLYTIFSYELSYQEAYVLLEGDNETNYECKIVSSKNASKETIQNACDKVQEELNTFTTRRSEILANEKVQSMLKNAPAIVGTNYDE